MKNLESEPVNIVAGTCAVTHENYNVLYDIADIRVLYKGQSIRPIVGGRLVGAKSRTENNGCYMGMDAYPLKKKIEAIAEGKVPPEIEHETVALAEQFVTDTGLMVTMEVMLPQFQLPQYEGRIPEGMLMGWTPAVEQLGWNICMTGAHLYKNNWILGIKNGKFLGSDLTEARNSNRRAPNSLEKTWKGLYSYVKDFHKHGLRVVMIQRGVDVPDGDYRNAPVHESVARLKVDLPDVEFWYDPSHTNGPKRVHHIVDDAVYAMQLILPDGTPLYNGLLVEAGKINDDDKISPTDNEQHIKLIDLEEMCTKIAEFRPLVQPKRKQKYY